MDQKVILITGVAGFIGANLALALLRDFKSVRIVGVDNMNDYYDVSLKEYRLAQILAAAEEKAVEDCFRFVKLDISDRAAVRGLFQEYQPDIVVNLAAQAGVRYSITNPDAYIESNIIGFYNILEACRHSYDGGNANQQHFRCDMPGANALGVKHLVYASSSSVYGSDATAPYSTLDKADSPVSLYAATKKSDELMAHAYAKLYNIPSTGLRFFTVYGPAGRPDMAYFGFADRLREGKKIQIFNYGNCKRDFTYIDDIVRGIILVMQGAPKRVAGEDGLPLSPHAVYNIGNSHPEKLLDFVDVLQQELILAGVLPNDYDFEAHKELIPMQPGDVAVTFADTDPLFRDFGFRPSTPLRKGLRTFAEWYREYYK
ncbi:MAG: NAD-dependent epimerase/dehydratase family protein [Lachnospiraceae bacterium]|nr:NAD-dependent epimerase/dehydratase family protein [Lachnospiraceae bacterium]